MLKGDITDFTELTDVNNNFNPRTGVFTINKNSEKGYYKFYVTGRKSGQNKKEGKIYVYKNKDKVQEIYDSDPDNWSMLSSIFTIHLKKGDEVKLQNQQSDSVYYNKDVSFTFSGNKI